MIRLYHPQLGVHHTVSTPRVAERYRRRGWVDAERADESQTEVPMTEDVGGEPPETETPDNTKERNSWLA